MSYFKSPLILGLLTLGALAACSSSSPPAAAPATSPPPAASAPAASGVPAAATSAKSETVKAEPTAENSAIETAAPLPAAGQLPALKWVAGKNYTPLSPAQPTDAPPGKVEVIEVFWYACPHCYALDPLLESWRKSKPDYISFRRVPVTWEDVHRSHGRLFYTLEALGKEEALHNEVFAEMHVRKNYMYAQGNAQETLASQVQFAKGHGISQADFMNAYNSFTVQSNMQRADDLVHRYRVEGVPTIIINGKYVTDEGMAGGPANVISIINDLAASERPH